MTDYDENKLIIEAQDQLLRQVIDPIIEETVDQAEWEEPPPGTIAPPPDKELLKSQMRTSLAESLYNHKEREYNLRGFDIVIQNLPRHPAGNICQAELQKAASHVGKTMSKKALPDPESVRKSLNADVGNVDIDKTLEEIVPFMEKLGLSERSYEIMYEIGIGLFERNDFESACCVFQFLSTLNVKCHESWHSCGVCYKFLNQWDSAISSFTVAIITNPANLHSFTHLAECYREVRKYDSAKETLEIAEHLLNTQVESAEEKRHLIEVIQLIRNEV